MFATVENYIPRPTSYTICNILLYEQIKSCLISTYPTIPMSFSFATFLLFQPIPIPWYINNSLSVYLFHDSEPSLGKSKESNHQGINVQKKLDFLPLKKTRKKMTRSASYFPNSQYTSVQQVLQQPISKSKPLYSVATFSNRISQPLAQDKKVANKHSVNCNPSPSGMISPRIHPLIFLYTLGLSRFPKILLIVISKQYISSWLEKKFQIYSVEITGKWICESKKNESRHFC